MNTVDALKDLYKTLCGKDYAGDPNPTDAEMISAIAKDAQIGGGGGDEFDLKAFCQEYGELASIVRTPAATFEDRARLEEAKKKAPEIIYLDVAKDPSDSNSRIVEEDYGGYLGAVLGALISSTSGRKLMLRTPTVVSSDNISYGSLWGPYEYGNGPYYKVIYDGGYTNKVTSEILTMASDTKFTRSVTRTM